VDLFITDFIAFATQQWPFMLLLLVLVAVLAFMESKKGGQVLSVYEATRMVNSGDAVFLDVRENKDFKNGHIVDALNIPHTKLLNRIDELKKQKGKTIIVVDKMGQHAGASGKVLKENDHTANRMRGGMSEWSGQNLPVVKG
jgi:rhodanese-related sulfurtransferase